MNATGNAQEFRKRTLKKVTMGILGCFGMAGLFLIIAHAGCMPAYPFMLIPASIPSVYFCIGLVELLTGRPCQPLADAWMKLGGWQRGVIGTLIVLVAGFPANVVITALVMWLT
jgi:hypothetical protein